MINFVTSYRIRKVDIILLVNKSCNRLVAFDVTLGTSKLFTAFNVTLGRVKNKIGSVEINFLLGLSKTINRKSNKIYFFSYTYLNVCIGKFLLIMELCSVTGELQHWKIN